MSSIRISSSFGTVVVEPCTLVEVDKVTRIEGTEQLPDFQICEEDESE